MPEYQLSTILSSLASPRILLCHQFACWRLGKPAQGLLDGMVRISRPPLTALKYSTGKGVANCLSGGHLKPDPYNQPAAIAATHGLKAAAAVAQFEADHIPEVKKVIEREGIDCDFVLTRCTDAFLTEDVYRRMKEGIQKLKKNQVSTVEDIVCAEGAEAEQVWNQLLSTRHSERIVVSTAHLTSSSLVSRVPKGA